VCAIIEVCVRLRVQDVACACALQQHDEGVEDVLYSGDDLSVCDRISMNDSVCEMRGV
jgi:hypothetical protein